MRGIYLHVPFCAGKCSYCDFYSVVPAGPEDPVRFREILLREMDLFRALYPEDAKAPSDSIYVGGGTPTVAGTEFLLSLLREIRARFPVEPEAEISVEANPGSVGPDDLASLRRGGFTRLSLGVQSFREGTLRTLGRRHGPGQVREAWSAARRAGFPSLGFDLIFGIPGQTLAGWEEDLDRTVTFLPSHVSAYALAPERGTPLHRDLGAGRLSLPDDDLVARMYERTREVLAGAGYRQYEISNFARPGHECRHNRKYWRREGYHGFGPSAHGLIFPEGSSPGGVRTANPPSLEEYGGAIRSGRLAWTEARAVSREEAWKEALIFGLRETEGVDLAALADRFGAPPEPLRGAVDRLAEWGKLVREGSRLRLPGHLMFVSNELLAEFA